MATMGCLTDMGISWSGRYWDLNSERVPNRGEL
jgi:hypothetical protein